jgi:hypothetical protein
METDTIVVFIDGWKHTRPVVTALSFKVSYLTKDFVKAGVDA